MLLAALFNFEKLVEESVQLLLVFERSLDKLGSQVLFLSFNCLVTVYFYAESTNLLDKLCTVL